MVYSCRDTAVDFHAVMPEVEAILTHYGANEPHCLLRARLPGESADACHHVFTNTSVAVASAITDWLLGGRVQNRNRALQLGCLTSAQAALCEIPQPACQ